MHLAHLEEESAKGDKEVESKDPYGINGVTKEFMVHLARAVKEAQVEENCCYHCSSLEHFIHNCPLVRSLRVNMQLNCKEGMAPKKGVWTPQTKDSLLESCSLSALAWGLRMYAKVKINGDSCMAVLDNGTQINTIMPSYAKSHSLEMGPITDLIGKRVTCIGLGNAFT